MRRLRRIFIIAVVASAVAFFSGDAVRPAKVSVSSALQNTTELVQRVIDGDTIELASGERVRYIGIDTPETVDPRRPVQCFGEAASSENQRLVERKEVRLVKDVRDKDQYGRLLRYVYVGDTFINLTLVEGGFALVETVPPDVAHASEFVSAAREAKGAQRGLWRSCTGVYPHTK